MVNKTVPFIAFEGPDGCGKTTQAKCLYDDLKSNWVDVILTREPGGTKVGEAVRKILLKPETGAIEPLAELLLYMAGRAQHVETVIRPALKAGKIVLCDRFIDASEAYQGYGRGVPLPFVRELNRISTGGLFPTRTILIDVDPAKALAQAIAKGKSEAKAGQPDRMEAEGLAFHKRVRAGYLEIAAREPERVRTIRRENGIEKTAALIREALRDLLP